MRYVISIIVAIVTYVLFRQIGIAGLLLGLIAAPVAGWLAFKHFDRYKRPASEAIESTTNNVLRVKDRVEAITSNEAAADYFAQAEQEADDGTYDKGLWSQALVKANGDESKRKITYMQLRAAQLQRQSRET